MRASNSFKINKSVVWALLWTVDLPRAPVNRETKKSVVWASSLDGWLTSSTSQPGDKEISCLSFFFGRLTYLEHQSTGRQRNQLSELLLWMVDLPRAPVNRETKKSVVWASSLDGWLTSSTSQPGDKEISCLSFFFGWLTYLEHQSTGRQRNQLSELLLWMVDLPRAPVNRETKKSVVWASSLDGWLTSSTSQPGDKEISCLSFFFGWLTYLEHQSTGRQRNQLSELLLWTVDLPRAPVNRETKKSVVWASSLDGWLTSSTSQPGDKEISCLSFFFGWLTYLEHQSTGRQRNQLSELLLWMVDLPRAPVNRETKKSVVWATSLDGWLTSSTSQPGDKEISCLSFFFGRLTYLEHQSTGRQTNQLSELLLWMVDLPRAPVNRETKKSVVWASSLDGWLTSSTSQPGDKEISCLSFFFGWLTYLEHQSTGRQRNQLSELLLWTVDLPRAPVNRETKKSVVWASSLDGWLTSSTSQPGDKEISCLSFFFGRLTYLEHQSTGSQRNQLSELLLWTVDLPRAPVNRESKKSVVWASSLDGWLTSSTSQPGDKEISCLSFFFGRLTYLEHQSTGRQRNQLSELLLWTVDLPRAPVNRETKKSVVWASSLDGWLTSSTSQPGDKEISCLSFFFGRLTYLEHQSTGRQRNQLSELLLWMVDLPRAPVNRETKKSVVWASSLEGWLTSSTSQPGDKEISCLSFFFGRLTYLEHQSTGRQRNQLSELLLWTVDLPRAPVNRETKKSVVWASSLDGWLTSSTSQPGDKEISCLSFFFGRLTYLEHQSTGRQRNQLSELLLWTVDLPRAPVNRETTSPTVPE